MAERELKVIGDGGRVLIQRPVELGFDADPASLESIARRYVVRQPFRYAEVTGPGLVAVFLAPDLIPTGTAVLRDPVCPGGIWLTSTVELGESDGAAVGPSVFFRMSELLPTEMWIEGLLVHLPLHVDSRERVFDDGTLVEWTTWGNRYFCWFDEGDLGRVYGAGNTNRDRFASVMMDARPQNALDYLWIAGAVRLA